MEGAGHTSRIGTRRTSSRAVGSWPDSANSEPSGRRRGLPISTTFITGCGQSHQRGRVLSGRLAMQVVQRASIARVPRMAPQRCLTQFPPFPHRKKKKKRCIPVDIGVGQASREALDVKAAKDQPAKREWSNRIPPVLGELDMRLNSSPLGSIAGPQKYQR